MWEVMRGRQREVKGDWKNKYGCHWKWKPCPSGKGVGPRKGGVGFLFAFSLVFFFLGEGWLSACLFVIGSLLLYIFFSFSFSFLLSLEYCIAFTTVFQKDCFFFLFCCWPPLLIDSSLSLSSPSRFFSPHQHILLVCLYALSSSSPPSFVCY